MISSTLRKLKHLQRITAAERRLIAEAVLFLGIARLLVLMVPFRQVAPWIARKSKNSVIKPDPLLNQNVRRAVLTAARNVPWQAVCLPQAIAAKFMLSR